MIGQRKAGAFLVSEIGRSGRERRSLTDRRRTSEPVPVDRRGRGERRIGSDRRLVTDVADDPASSPAAVVDASLDAIALHRRALAVQVGRDVGEDVAALDYFLNVRPDDPRGTFIERGSLADPITGLFNRAFLDSSLRRELARCRRHGVMASLVLIELDDFKATNDQWGPAAGEAALRGVADAIRRQLRAADVACRHGSDEFAIVLPDTYRSGALLVAERIVTDVRRSFVGRRVAGCPLALTVSVGVAWYGAQCSTSGELLEAAHRALLLAKAAGGDRVAEG